MDNESKGKGKAKAGNGATFDDPVPDQATTNGQSPNLAQRIMDSAKGLARDALSSDPNAASTLASSSALEQKSSSASSAPTQQAYEASRQRSRPDTAPDEQWRTHGSLREGVALTSEGVNVDEQLERFERMGIGLPAEGIFAGENISGAGEMENLWTRATMSGRHVQEDDGAAVRELLADPSFDASASTSLNLEEEQTQPLWPRFQSSRTAQANNLRREDLPQPPKHKPMPSNHPLSLKPRTSAENLAISENIEDILNGTYQNEQTPKDPRNDDEWLNDWLGVLNSYTDEVWGDMLPVVREARGQLEEIKADGGGMGKLDSKAVARLRMIVGHLEGGR